MSAKAAPPRALRDSALFFGAQLGARAINFGYFLILARALPIDEFGVLNYALSIVILLDILLDLGLSRHAMRELSKTPEQSGAFIRRILPYKLGASAAVFAAFCGAVLLSDAPGTYKTITIFAALGLFFTAPAMLLENVLQAHHRFALISLAHVVLAVLQFVLGICIIALGGGTVLISLTFALTYLTYAGIAAWGLRGLRASLPARADYRGLLRSIPAAFPYLVSTLVIMLAIRAEFLILGFFGTKADLAVFGMATKIVEASLLLPMAFATVMSPRFSKAHGQTRDVLARVYFSGLEMILLLSVPLALVAQALVPLAQWVLGTAEYDAIDDVLHISFLGYVAAAVFLYNTAALFGAVNQRRPLMILTGLGALQVAVNLALQAPFGMFGAAAAFVVFMALAALLTTWAILRMYAHVSGIGAALAAPAAGAGGVALFLALFGTSPAVLVGAAAVYGGTAYALRRTRASWVTDLELNPEGM